MPADAGDPDTFAIGSVTFTTVTKFNQQMAAKFDAYVRRDGSPLETEIDEGLLADARHYFDGFTWVGEVKVLNCDAGTSKMRGQLAVTAALNFVHVLFGSYHTDRMMGAGSRMDKDRRAHMTMNDAGRIDISCSSSAASAVGFSNGWGRLLEGESMEVLLSGAGKSLEPLVNPAVRRPLGTRLTDAVGWFGDAVREEAPAAQIVKAVTALETLVMTDEHEEIASLLSARAAALCYDPQQEKTFEELNATMLHAYDMRSRLAHGSLSPLDAEVAAYAPECLHWAERVICGGLGLLESHGLLDRTLTRKQLAEGMTCLVEWASPIAQLAERHRHDSRNHPFHAWSNAVTANWQAEFETFTGHLSLGPNRLPVTVRIGIDATGALQFEFDTIKLTEESKFLFVSWHSATREMTYFSLDAATADGTTFRRSAFSSSP